MTASDASSRQSALDRLTAHAPFLARLADLNPDDVARFLADNSRAERVPIRPEDWPGLEHAIDAAGDFRTTPAMLGGMDGFFASVLRRAD